MTGGELRARRRQLGLAQGALAQWLDVSQQTLSRWELGKLRIRHARILDLALRAIEADPVRAAWAALGVAAGERA